VFEALKAYDELKAQRTLIRVIDLYSVAPVDRDALVAAARATAGRLITVEDHYAAGGIGDAVAEAVAGRFHRPPPCHPRDRAQRKTRRAPRALRDFRQSIIKEVRSLKSEV